MGDRLGIHGAVGSFCRGAGVGGWIKPTVLQLGSGLDGACPHFLTARAVFNPFLRRQNFQRRELNPGLPGESQIL